MKLFRILLISALCLGQAFAQKHAPANWFNLDFKADKVWGVSTEKAYKELSLDKNTNKVIVAVIDAGTDIDHEDLKANLWINPKEVAGNQVDDDKNGYVDDVYGWCFIGSSKGTVNADTYEYSRILGSYYQKGLKPGDTPVFKSNAEKDLFFDALALQEKTFKTTQQQYLQFSMIMDKLKEMIAKTGSENPTKKQLKAIKVDTKQDKQLKKILVMMAKKGPVYDSPLMKQLKQAESQMKTMMEVNLNTGADTRYLVGDNYEDVTEKFYGSPKVNIPDMDHGTHVAGIIAANRSNKEGIKGICNNALIMTLKVVPNGDERDKDVANAIRYAADNGAKVINMSFGKKLSPNKSAVDEAIVYAMGKDVLFVHAAGNEGENLAENPFYPMRKLNNGTTVPNWIEVGALGWQKGKKGRVADFSNYGKGEVDLFAPGVDIESTMPGSVYKQESGTSMASPVVAGVAALVRQNYPNLTAVQTKQILLISAVPCEEEVLKPGTDETTTLKELCATGGVVNAYEALILAEKVSTGKVKLP
ncbi:MAG: peptidase S8 [Bacteroidetes bacterium B1(2017)]|nr:MAG: peptidase S8 [Bacteroidetes bacterium B1(2017)]